MKYLLTALLLISIFFDSISQGGLPENFLNGKSVVLISNSPQARPVYSWMELAEEIHPALVEAGGDPIAYFELEDVSLSEEIQAGYSNEFLKRQVGNVVILTRKNDGSVALNIGPFSQNKSLLTVGNVWGVSASSIDQVREQIVNLGRGIKTNNLLVLEVPEFPPSAGASSSSQRYLARNPLNLDVFKLGIPLSGSAGESGYLSTFRYDLLGKSEEQILREQNAEKAGLEVLFSALYPYQVEYLTSPKTDAELIQNRIQFQLMRVEAREGDLMQSMGIPVNNPDSKNRIVVKYYIRFLVRNELYIGPEWDADPDWRVALENFLKNLAKK